VIYDTFNSIADTLGSYWENSGNDVAHAAFVAGLLFWFVIERFLGFIATPIIKAASVTVVLIITFLAISVLNSFGTYSEGERPKVTIEESNRQILMDAVK
jgi:hypothetical protein